MYDVDPILPCLRQIIFDNNPIESIEKNLFYGLRESNLQEISLVNCNLKEIHASKNKQNNNNHPKPRKNCLKLSLLSHCKQRNIL